MHPSFSSKKGIYGQKVIKTVNTIVLWENKKKTFPGYVKRYWRSDVKKGGRQGSGESQLFLVRILAK